MIKVITFCADWSDESKFQIAKNKSIVDEDFADKEFVKFEQVDVEKDEDKAIRYGVYSVPTTLVLNKVNRTVPEEFIRFPGRTKPNRIAESINDAIKRYT